MSLDMADMVCKKLAQEFYEALKATSDFGGLAVTIDYTGLPKRMTYRVGQPITIEVDPPVVDVAALVEAGMGAGPFSAEVIRDHTAPFLKRICKDCGRCFENRSDTDPSLGECLTAQSRINLPPLRMTT